MWSKILNELKNFTSGNSLSPAALDTLYGSMWGLNIRFRPLNDVLKESSERKPLFQYSIRRLEGLLKIPDISFKPKEINRCGIGFGTYGWRYDHSLILEAVSLGAQLIDTAEGYGYGKVEYELGQALKKIHEPVEIATKVRRDHMSLIALVASVSRSIEKLGRIPHLQLHYPHDKYSDESLGSTLVDLRRKGKILSTGLSNCSVDMIESMQRFLSDYSGDIIRSVQVEYSLINRRIEGFLLPYCQKRGILVIAYSPLGQSYKKIYKPILKDIAEEKKCKPIQVALAWLLSRPGVLPIPRTNNMKHLQQNIEATEIELCQSEIEEIEKYYPKDKVIL